DDPAGPGAPVGPWMFQEMGSSRFKHLDESVTTRSNPVILCLHAWITALSVDPESGAASAASAPAQARTANAPAAASKRARGARKTLGITLLSLGASSGSRQVVTCLCPVRDKSGTSVSALLTRCEPACSLSRQ